MKTNIIIEYQLEDIQNIAQKLLTIFEYPIICFEGQMGAGKTTLINAICEELKVLDKTNSPTFSIVNEYSSNDKTIYHFDLYRLKNAYEALDFGIEDYLDSGNFCLIEWHQVIESLLPTPYHVLKFDLVDANTRQVEVCTIIS